VRSVKTIIVIEGKFDVKEETGNKRIELRKLERKKIIDSAPALAYVV